MNDKLAVAHPCDHVAYWDGDMHRLFVGQCKECDSDGIKWVVTDKKAISVEAAVSTIYGTKPSRAMNAAAIAGWEIAQVAIHRAIEKAGGS